MYKRQEQISSNLNGNLTLGSDAKIPEWATLTIEEGESITIPDGITLTNDGTLTNHGLFINNGTFVNNKTLDGSQPLKIGGEDGLGITKMGSGVTLKYESKAKLLNISGKGKLTVSTNRKPVDSIDEKPVECEIVTENADSILLTIKNLYLLSLIHI